MVEFPVRIGAIFRTESSLWSSGTGLGKVQPVGGPSPVLYGSRAKNGVYIFKWLKRINRRVIFCDMGTLCDIHISESKSSPEAQPRPLIYALFTAAFVLQRQSRNLQVVPKA